MERSHSSLGFEPEKSAIFASGKTSLMIAEQTGHRRREASPTRVQRILYLLLPLLLISGALIAYKSSAALTVIGKVSATGVLAPIVKVMCKTNHLLLSGLALTSYNSSGFEKSVPGPNANTAASTTVLTKTCQTRHARRQRIEAWRKSRGEC